MKRLYMRIMAAMSAVGLAIIACSSFSPNLKLIVDHLTLRVTEEFKLPVDADLVAEAKTFCQELLSENRP